MCGRYAVLTQDEIIKIRDILKTLSLKIVQDNFENDEKECEEVFPTDHAPVIMQETDGISFQSIKWGFKRWDGAGVIINARSETIKTKSTFSSLLPSGRCVVPAGEFFEWEKLEGGKRKYFVKDQHSNLLFMAGLYCDEEEGRAFVIITKQSTGNLSRIHDRMPVILHLNQVEGWLNGELSPDDLKDLDYGVEVKPCEESGEQISLF